ncbi:MAG: hypothetical protein AABN95_16050 [Acidobacteriota bacterium]
MTGMKYDPKRRLYLDDRGRAISPAKVRKQIDGFITSEQKLVIQAARRLLSGEAEVEAFFRFMQTKVTAWHSITGTIAYGGKSEMNVERWARLNARIFSELGYLSEFQADAQASFTAAEIIANKVSIQVAKEFPQAQAEIRERVSRALFTTAPSEAVTVAKRAVIEVIGAEVPIVAGPEAGFLIGGTVENRASLYPGTMWRTHEMETLNRERDAGVLKGRRRTEEDGNVCDGCMAAATEEFIPLDEIEEIGTQECGPRDRCEIEFGDEDSSFRTSEIFSGVISGQERYGGDVELN